MSRSIWIAALAGLGSGILAGTIVGLAAPSHGADSDPTPTPTVAVQPPESVTCPEGTVPGWQDENGYYSSCVSDVPYWPQDVGTDIGPDLDHPAPPPGPQEAVPAAPILSTVDYTG